VTSRKDFSNGPVWDPERERYFVEVRFPDGSRKKKRFRRQREAQRWWTLEIAKIEDGSWNVSIPKMSSSAPHSTNTADIRRRITGRTRSLSNRP
jgi:hypothetical protein